MWNEEDAVGTRVEVDHGLSKTLIGRRGVLAGC